MVPFTVQVPSFVSLCLAALNSCALNNGGCEHDCVQVTLAQHRCQCRHNHQLHQDGKRCVCESLGLWDGDAQVSSRANAVSVSPWGLGSHGFPFGAVGWECSDVQQGKRCVCESLRAVGWGYSDVQQGNYCVCESLGAGEPWVPAGSCGMGMLRCPADQTGGFPVKTLCVLLSWTCPVAYSRGWEELEEGSQQK